MKFTLIILGYATFLKWLFIIAIATISMTVFLYNQILNFSEQFWNLDGNHQIPIDPWFMKYCQTVLFLEY